MLVASRFTPACAYREQLYVLTNYTPNITLNSFKSFKIPSFTKFASNFLLKSFTSFPRCEIHQNFLFFLEVNVWKTDLGCDAIRDNFLPKIFTVASFASLHVSTNIHLCLYLLYKDYIYFLILLKRDFSRIRAQTHLPSVIRRKQKSLWRINLS